ncbi:MAG: NrfD/PsrC family molybdoenzyme membrane anchor subunit, partial [Acidimicrobiia bacterium]|nr:NrfD/PsrC family molybdoenzyme membrane anchor subunit [Acidimicrobiia bacterium]
TAFLFGQAEARDLWQAPTLLWHMIAGAVGAGGAAGLVLSLVLDTSAATQRVFAMALLGGAVALGLLALAEVFAHHPTRNIAQAAHHLTRGVFARQWWVGGQLLGVVVPVLCAWGVLAGSPLWVGALGGLAAWAGIWFADDAFVKAGQSVPLS